MKKTFYKDKTIEIKIEENLDHVEMVDSATICIEAGLAGIKTFCTMAKNPLELWEYCEKNLHKIIKYYKKSLIDNN